ncbi:MAG TPA: hypothetical protein RMH99_26665 [Sandaracinaceae bacterium LLY-WYZ-13_1]|nr:hypothetical protein [Sandaracinaceae bacterium LLY-WYZ-13_1]
MRPGAARDGGTTFAEAPADRTGEAVDTEAEGLEADPFDAALMRPEPPTRIGIDAPGLRPELATAQARIRRAGEAVEEATGRGLEVAQTALEHLAHHRSARPIYLIGALAALRAVLAPALGALLLTAWLVAAAGGAADGGPKVFPKTATEAADSPGPT